MDACYVDGVPRTFGWIRDAIDFRDTFYAHKVVPATETAKIASPDFPAKYDLRETYPKQILKILDQRDIGACAFNAGAQLVYFEQMKQHQSWFMPCRLAWYYNVRKAMGTLKSDSGASIRDTMKVLNTCGVCREDLLPYTKDNLYTTPGYDCGINAELHKSLIYSKVDQDLASIKTVLQAGHPIEFGVGVYSSFVGDNVSKTGIVPMPGRHECLQGGHAVVAYGWDDDFKWGDDEGDKGVVICANSWGAGWGDKGYFYLPYQYILNPDLAADFWCLTLMQKSG